MGLGGGCSGISGVTMHGRRVPAGGILCPTHSCLSVPLTCHALAWCWSGGPSPQAYSKMKMQLHLRWNGCSLALRRRPGALPCPCPPCLPRPPLPPELRSRKKFVPLKRNVTLKNKKERDHHLTPTGAAETRSRWAPSMGRRGTGRTGPCGPRAKKGGRARRAIGGRTVAASRPRWLRDAPSPLLSVRPRQQERTRGEGGHALRRVACLLCWCW
jgi:hypothetical protein